MESVALVVASAVGTFAVTNVDDFVVLTALLAASDRTGPSRRQVIVGQYVGIAALVAVSALAALGLLVVPDRWVGLLGLVPLALGIRGLLVVRRARAQAEPAGSVQAVPGVLGVAALTIANGADNVAVYTPVFRQTGAAVFAVYVVVFALLVALWVVAAVHLAGRRPVIALVDRVGHWLVPLVFVAIGVVIVVSSHLLRG